MWHSVHKIIVVPALRTLTSNVMHQIKTFVFLDLETTGLPYMEHNLTKITEMSAVAVQADHIELGCFPRVHNKLAFCFNPNRFINPVSSEITGLSNELLEHQASFSCEVVDVLNKWLDVNKKPLCFVAHNGNRFDYPILRAEINKAGGGLCGDILCVDSLTAFRDLDKLEPESEEGCSKGKVPFEFSDDYDKILCEIAEAEEKKLTPEDVQRINETTPKKQTISSQTQTPSCNNSAKRNFNQKKAFISYKLEDIFTRLTSKTPVNAHEAEGDVTMLITCAAYYGEKFVEYCNENAVKFSDIPPMTPGKKIGT